MDVQIRFCVKLTKMPLIRITACAVNVAMVDDPLDQPNPSAFLSITYVSLY